ncbi:MAG TPA: alpha/beta hydrolase-fold protein, partial [Chloroflexota bacterium]
DVVAEIDGRYRTLADRDHRAVGGLSMGGFGALSLAMVYPATFGTAGAHSPALWSLPGPAFFGDATYFAQHDPVQLLRRRPATARGLKLWLDVAQGDPLDQGRVEALHQQLLQDGVPHQWHEWPGGHSAAYWGAHMDDYLRFYDAALR